MLALSPRLRPGVLLTLAITAALACIGLLSATQLVGDNSKTGLLIAAGLVVAPILAYLALRRPIIFPFAIYAAAVPFDNLLKTDAGGTATRLLAIFAALAIGLQLVVRRSAIAPSRSLLLWGGLIVWMGATIFWAIDGDAAVAQFVRYLQLYLVFGVVSIYSVKSNDLKILIGAVIAGACAATLYGDYLFHNGQGAAIQRLVVTSGTSHIDPNHFAASLVMPLALAMMMFLRCKLILRKGLLLAVVGILLTGFITSASRGGLLAVVVVMLFFFVRSRYKIQVALGGIAAALVIAPSTLIARFSQVQSTGGAGRLDIWNSALNAFKQHWIVGSGIGNFPYAYDQVYLLTFHQSNHWHVVAHDLIAQTSVEMGLIGLVLTLFAWFWQFKSLDFIRPGDPLYDLRVALQAGMVGLFVAALFVDVMWYKYVWLAFGMVALACNLAVQARAEHSRVASARPAVGRSPVMAGTS